MVPGERLGPYQLIRELGRGGMGVVYLGCDTRVDRVVALKLLSGLWADDDLVLRFRAEALAIARLRHPAIVAVHELGRDGARHYLALDYVEGESLADRLSRGPLESLEALRMVLAIASALEHAHAHSILHRDIKPANILLDGSGRPILTDFGLAKDLSDSKERLTRTGELLGTPAYMAPEQASGDAVDVRTDVYGLGATLYAMLTGDAPFRAGSVLGLLNKVVNVAPAPPSRFNASVPAGLDAICLRCLAKPPQARYASAADLAAAVEDLLAGKGRGPTGRALLGLALVLVACAALAILAFGAEPRPAVERPSVAPHTTQAATVPASRAAQLRQGEREFRRLERLDDEALVEGASRWLDAHPHHPLADQVRSLRALGAPMLAEVESGGPVAGLGFVGPRLLVHWVQAASAIQFSRIEPDGLVSRSSQPLPGPIQGGAVLDGQVFVSSEGVLHQVGPTGQLRALPGAEPLGGGAILVEASPTGDLVATCNNSYLTPQIRLIDSRSGEILWTVAIEIPSVIDAAFSPDGRRLALVAGQSLQHAAAVRSRLILFDVSTPRSATIVETGDDAVLGSKPGCVAFSSSGERIVVGTVLGHLLLFRGDTGLRTGHIGDATLDNKFPGTPVGMGFAVRGGVVTRDERVYVCAGVNDGIQTGAFAEFDLATGRLVRRVKRRRSVVALALSPDDSLLALGLLGGGLELWRTRAPEAR